MSGKPKSTLWQTFQVGLLIVAGVLVFVADQFSVPIAGDAAMVFFGALIVTVGIDMFAQRVGILQINGWTEQKVVDTYRGLTELIWAIVTMGLGLLLTSYMFAKWLAPGRADQFLNGLVDSPTGIGLVLAGVGLMTLLHGLIRALAGSGQVDPQKLGGVPFFLDRLAGAGVFILGGVASGIGVLLLIAPGIVATTLNGLKNLVFGP